MRGRVAIMGLQVPVGEPWYADLRSELLSFQAGKHGDQVDAFGLVGQLLSERSSTERKTLRTLAAKDSYRPVDELPSDSDSILLR